MTKPGKTQKWAARGERLSAALRENLKRRKAQARNRERARQSAGRDETAAQGAKREVAKLPAQNPDFRRNESG